MLELLRELVAQGRVVIPANKNHTNLDPEGIGESLENKGQCKCWNIERLL